MPRAFDRGIPADDKNPLRNAADWNDPEGVIGQGATEAAGILGQVFRGFLALDQIEAAFAEFAEEFVNIDWLSPAAVRQAITAAGKLLADIGRWMLTLFEHFTRLDLTDNSDFVRDLLALLAFADLQAAWETFSNGWSALNWSNPLEAIHPAWMLVVDFGWGIWGWIGQLLSNILGIDLPDFFEADTFKGVWQAFTAAWSAINWTSLAAIWGALRAIGTLLRGLAHWAITVFQNLTGIDFDAVAASFNLDDLVDAITTWADTLAGIDWLADPIGGLMTAIGAFITLAQALGNWILGIIEAWLGWNVNIVHAMFASFNDFVGTVIRFFWGADGLAVWTGALAAIGGVGATILDAIKGAYDGITRFVGLIGTFLDLNSLVEFIAGILGEDGLLGWLASLPLIGPLVARLTGGTPSGNAALDLAELGNWAGRLLTQGSSINAANLFGSISDAVFATIPVSHISLSNPNLMSQGNFNNTQTVEAGGGVEWDSATTATGSGGSLKFVGTGALQERFSRQAIKVNDGDRLNVSAMVQTSGFTPAAGRAAELSIIPWKLVGGVMTQQPTVVIATRTSSASAFTAMTGDTYAVSGGVVRVTPRLSVVANTGAIVRFDDVKVSKTGTLAQGLVEYLTATWEAAWNTVFGSGGAGKIWSDFVTAIQTVFTTAGTGVTNAGTALGNIVSVIDAIGKAVFGEATYNDLPSQVKTALQHFINKLFGVNTVQDELTSGVIPPLSGSVIADGEISIDVLPTDDIGAEINPSSGSGAQLSRRDTANANATGGQHRFPAGFYSNVDVSGTDVAVLNSSNATVSGTGAKANLGGVFKALTAGWYLVELCVRINPPVSFGTHIAPVLYRSANYPTSDLAVYKVGGDGTLAFWGFGGAGPRYVQSSFVVYLPAGGAVAAGYDCELTTSGMFDADSNGTQTYFSIALLNKTYA